MKAFAVSLAAMALAVVVSHCAAKNYDVGDSNGWTNGISYTSWPTGKSFVVGDTLTFTYASGLHDVNELSSTAYTNCDFSTPIKTWTSGHDVITLDKTGDWYFACSYGGGLHCKNGMKLHITVSSAASTTPTPAAATTPPPPPARPASPSSSSPSPPSASGSSPSLFSGCSVAVLVVLVSILGI